MHFVQHILTKGGNAQNKGSMDNGAVYSSNAGVFI